MPRQTGGTHHALRIGCSIGRRTADIVLPARQFCMDHCRSYWSYRADADFSFTQKPGMVLRTDRAVCRSIDRFYALGRLRIQRYA